MATEKNRVGFVQWTGVVHDEVLYTLVTSLYSMRDTTLDVPLVNRAIVASVGRKLIALDDPASSAAIQKVRDAARTLKDLANTYDNNAVLEDLANTYDDDAINEHEELAACKAHVSLRTLRALSDEIMTSGFANLFGDVGTVNMHGVADAQLLDFIADVVQLQANSNATFYRQAKCHRSASHEILALFYKNNGRVTDSAIKAVLGSTKKDPAQVAGKLMRHVDMLLHTPKIHFTCDGYSKRVTARFRDYYALRKVARAVKAADLSA